jgi:hypothetical protein
MFPPTPDAIHQLAADRRREASAAAEAHRATYDPGRRRRTRRLGWSLLRLPLPRAGHGLDPTVVRPRQA